MTPSAFVLDSGRLSPRYRALKIVDGRAFYNQVFSREILMEIQTYTVDRRPFCILVQRWVICPVAMMIIATEHHLLYVHPMWAQNQEPELLPYPKNDLQDGRRCHR